MTRISLTAALLMLATGGCVARAPGVDAPAAGPAMAPATSLFSR